MKSLLNKFIFPPSHKNGFSEQAWRQLVLGQDPAQLYAPHFDGQRFYNPWLQQARGWRDMLAYFMDKTPAGQPPIPYARIDSNWLKGKDFPDSLIWLGHASVAMRAMGQLILLDPFLSERAFTIKRAVPASVQAQLLPSDSLVIISHNHYDHLDRRTVAHLAEATFVCPLGVGGLLHSWGARKIKELDWWQSIQWRDITINCLPAHHWSRRLAQNTNRSLWASYLLEFNGRKAYFAGDSAYFVGYREIGARFPDIDLAILPCGAYAPRWFMHQAHMDVNEMFMAFNDMGARFLLPVHWGSIALGHEPINQPAEHIANYLRENPQMKEKVLPLAQGRQILFSELQCQQISCPI